MATSTNKALTGVGSVAPTPSTQIGTSFGGLKTNTPNISPTTNNAAVGTGAVAGLPAKAPATNPIVQGANMSTVNGPAKGGITTGIITDNTPKTTTSTQPTTTATANKFQDINGKYWATQAEANKASEPTKPTTTPPPTTITPPATTSTTPPTTTPPTTQGTEGIPTSVGMRDSGKAKDGSWILGYNKLTDTEKQFVAGLTEAQQKQLDTAAAQGYDQYISAYQQIKSDQEYAAKQRDYQIQVTDINGQIQTIQGSADLRKIGEQVDGLKQTYAYLGQMGSPGKSSQHLDSVSKAIKEAEQTFADAKAIETYKDQLQVLGKGIDTSQYEKQVADLANKMNTEVPKEIQNALNAFTSADLSGKLDTTEGIQQYQRALLTDLDNRITSSTAITYQQISDLNKMVQQQITDAKQTVKDMSTVSPELSTAQGVYTNVLGQPIKDASGNTIQYTQKPFYTNVDSKGNLVIVSEDGKGGYKTNIVPVNQPTNYSDNVVGGVMDQYRAGTLTSAQAISILGNDKFADALANPSKYSTQGVTSSIGTYTPVSQGEWMSQVQDLTANPTQYQNINAQCGQGINNLLHQFGIAQNVFTDPISAKTAATNSSTASVGEVAVFDWSKAANATDDQKKYGHVGIVTKVGANGQPTEIADWNWKGDGKYSVHAITPGNASCISGYFDPTKGATPTQGTEDSSGGMYQDFLKGLSTQGQAAFNAIPSEDDKSTIEQLVSGDALMADIVKSRGGQGTTEIKRLTNLALKVDPDFSINQNKQRYAFKTEWNNANGKSFTTRNAINTAIGHLAELKDASVKLSNTTINKYNSIKNMVKKETGDPAVAEFDFAMGLLASEIATAYKGASPSDQDVESIRNTLESSYSPKQMQAVLDKASSMMSSKISSTANEYRTIMGAYPTDPIVQDSQIQALRASGVSTAKIDAILKSEGYNVSAATPSSTTPKSLSDIRNNL